MFTFKSLNLRFIFIGALLLTVFMSYVAVEYSFTHKISGYAKRINYAGQLRFRSFEIAWIIHRLYVEQDSRKRKSLTSELNSRVISFDEIIYAFNSKNQKLGIKPIERGDEILMLSRLISEWNHEMKPALVNIPLLPADRMRAEIEEYDKKIYPYVINGIDQFAGLLESNYNAIIRNTNLSRVYTLAIFFAAGIFVILFLRRNIILPVHNLKNATVELEKGNFDIIVPANTSDEIGLLTRSFNDMAAAVRNYEKNLKMAKDELEDRVSQRTIELSKTNELLTISAHELKVRNREINLLGKISEIIQTSRSIKEVCPVIANLMKQLFPEDSGALYLLNRPRNILEAVAQWGDITPQESIFTPEDCWALRLGRLHTVIDKASGLVCKHTGTFGNPYFCAPMFAAGETLGIVHVTTKKFENMPSDESEFNAKQQLVLSAAERIGLSLANLKLRTELHELSIKDSITGLYNRRYMEEFLDRELLRSKRKNTKVGIIMFDIDFFKQFNDTYGHDTGDVILRELGALFKKKTRSSDIACRYGGEEFIIVLTESPLEETLKHAEYLRLSAQQIQILCRPDTPCSITISAGAAVFPDHGLKVRTLLKAADTALYQSKQSGRNRVTAAANYEEEEIITI